MLEGECSVPVKGSGFSFLIHNADFQAGTGSQAFLPATLVCSTLS